LPLAGEYFPDLTIQNNRICRITDSGVVPLESDTSTALLLDYLNPSLKEIEDTEVIQAAKFVYWAQNDPDHRKVQVEVGINHFKKKMLYYAKLYSLDGIDDTVCLVVADILHQGRAKSPVIAAALQSSNPLESLLKIGEPKYHERLVTLKREIKALTNDGTLGKRKYSANKADFVIK
jgi:ribosomal protein L18E